MSGEKGEKGEYDEDDFKKQMKQNDNVASDDDQYESKRKYRSQMIKSPVTRSQKKKQKQIKLEQKILNGISEIDSDEMLRLQIISASVGDIEQPLVSKLCKCVFSLRNKLIDGLKQLLITPEELSNKMSDEETYCNDQSLFAYPNLDGVGYIYAIGCHSGHYLLMKADLVAHSLSYADTQRDCSERSYILSQFCQFLHDAWAVGHGAGREFPWHWLFKDEGRQMAKMWYQPTQLRNFLLRHAKRLRNKFTSSKVSGMYALIALDYLMKDGCDEAHMPSVDLGDSLKQTILQRFYAGELDIINIDYKNERLQPNLLGQKEIQID
ncbi:MAG: hypothetical protein EZS28_005088 [Streblomastix strix]|uniref:Uncharacterized protein n=1 Tax=Streblomastix strix TaxID=222440 RepID=A0A5J4WWG9_9EUKA|nr:MAG: hypothetical protein EZS28_005088 [Streblomastix strix]